MKQVSKNSNFTPYYDIFGGELPEGVVLGSWNGALSHFFLKIPLTNYSGSSLHHFIKSFERIKHYKLSFFVFYSAILTFCICCLAQNLVDVYQEINRKMYTVSTQMCYFHIALIKVTFLALNVKLVIRIGNQYNFHFRFCCNFQNKTAWIQLCCAPWLDLKLFHFVYLYKRDL